MRSLASTVEVVVVVLQRKRGDVHKTIPVPAWLGRTIPERPCAGYSLCSALAGLMRIARWAGIYEAMIPTATIASAATASVSTSVGATPNNKFESVRVASD